MPKLQALFFDQDGVIVDTERDGHRVAFNDAFQHFDLPIAWSVQRYHQLLQVGGGKERMKHQYQTEGFGRDIAADEADELVKQMHAWKTDRFIELIETGKLPLRPGVHAMMKDATDAGVVVGICTTSNQRAADAIVKQWLSDIPLAFVLAGDVVPRKKPDPAIYQMGLEKTSLAPEHGLVFEDSHIGVTAAKAAGLRVIATVNGYTKDEDLSAADAVVTSLGNAAEPAQIIRAGEGFPAGPTVTFDAVRPWFEQ